MNWEIYDELVLNRSVMETGCRTPYQNGFKQFPLCSTQEEMKKAAKLTNPNYMNDLHPPCVEMSQLNFDVQEFDDDQPGKKFNFKLYIQLPNQLKRIRQSAAIDIHSFIGNVGGYIGLFLGNFSRITYPG